MRALEESFARADLAGPERLHQEAFLDEARVFGARAGLEWQQGAGNPYGELGRGAGGTVSLEETVPLGGTVSLGRLPGGIVSLGGLSDRPVTPPGLIGLLLGRRQQLVQSRQLSV